MRILIFGSYNIKLFSHVFDFDDHDVFLLLSKDEKSRYNNLIEKCESNFFNFSNFSDIDFSEFDKFDLFIVSSGNDSVNSLKIFAIFVPVLSLITHQKNIERIIKGEETKLTFDKK